MERFVCIHGHFYQPPRENAWLEVIEQQDSAYPFHDWNERISFECYGPNAYSRILNNKGEIIDIVNNIFDLFLCNSLSNKLAIAYIINIWPIISVPNSPSRENFTKKNITNNNFKKNSLEKFFFL